DDCSRTAVEARPIHTLHHLRITARPVLGDIHDLETERNRILHGLLCCVQQKIVAPAFRVTANRTRSKKRRRCNVQPGALHNLCNRPDVVFMRPSCTVRTDLHFVIDDLSRQCLHMLTRTRPSSRQPQIERIDAQSFHQVQDVNFFFDRRIAHRWRLQPIPQAFIVQENGVRRAQRRRLNLVPIVDELRSLHAIRFAGGWASSPVPRARTQPLPLCIVRVGTVALGVPCEAERNFLCVPLRPLWLLINAEVTEESRSVERASPRLLRLRPNRQPKNRSLPLPRHIQSAHCFRIGQVECFAVLTPVYLGIFSPSLLRVATSLLKHISCVIPPFKMPATKFALSIVFIAGALPLLPDLDLMMWKLLR